MNFHIKIRAWALTAVCVLILSSTLVMAQQPPAGGTIHVVQRGETLFRIAQSYGLTTDVLARVNGILNPSNILVGQRLIIPGPDFIPETETPETYIVQFADTLASISAAFGVNLETLVALNSLANPDSIYVGQVLRLSGEIPQTDAPAEGAPDSPEPPREQVIHRVQRGETLFRIAQKYDVNMSAIQAANGIQDASRIFAGQDLIIPDARTSSAVSALPDGIATIDLTPLVLTEGKSARLLITSAAPATVNVTFLNRVIPVSSSDGGVAHRAFLPVALGTAPGIYDITVSVADTTGRSEVLRFNVQVTSGGYGRQYITLPDSKVPLLVQGVEDNERGLLEALTSRYTSDLYVDGPMGLPAAASMFSAFGAERAYNGSDFNRHHTGADFAGAPGTPVIAAAAGRVVLADTLNIRGVCVVIDHGWGVYTLYAHMSDRYVNLGDFVQAGQAIGAIGSTGRATGAHLHWEVWLHGTPVDPMQWAAEAFP